MAPLKFFTEISFPGERLDSENLLAKPHAKWKFAVALAVFEVIDGVAPLHLSIDGQVIKIVSSSLVSVILAVLALTHGGRRTEICAEREMAHRGARHGFPKCKGDTPQSEKERHKETVHRAKRSASPIGASEMG